MHHNEILDQLAPCGLNCRKCMAKEDGDIQHHSRALSVLLLNFDKYADRFSEFMPVFRKYSEFKSVLEYLSQGDCLGCRQGTCNYPHCGVRTCYIEKGVDFCFQCDEFPCSRSNFDPDLHRRWIEMNNRLKEIGIEAYFHESQEKPRYQ